MTLVDPAPLAVVAAVLVRRGHVLLACRPLHKARPGQWEFPGGKVEAGETPEQALRREIAEELGCTIAVGRAVTTVAHRYPDLAISLTAYWATVSSGEPYAREVLALSWRPLEALTSCDLSEADRLVAEAILRQRHPT